ncbi:hypothetical protein, partial [Tsukamurella spumae]
LAAVASTYIMADNAVQF